MKGGQVNGQSSQRRKQMSVTSSYIFKISCLPVYKQSEDGMTGKKSCFQLQQKQMKYLRINLRRNGQD